MRVKCNDICKVLSQQVACTLKLAATVRKLKLRKKKGLAQGHTMMSEQEET